MYAGTISLNAERAARLMDVTVQWMRGLVSEGKIAARRGPDETTWDIPLDSLPFEAQMRYWRETGAQVLGKRARLDNFDLAGYKSQYKEIGIRALKAKQEAALTVIGLKAGIGRGINAELPDVAAYYGTSPRSLLRWASAYQAEGLAGLARDRRNDSGQSRSMCLEAQRFVAEEYLNPVKRTQESILDALFDRAKQMGARACDDCPYNPESLNHAALIEAGRGDDFPACPEAGQGIQIPRSRYAVNRVIAGISDEEKTYMRVGRKAWEAAYMMKATRAKPDVVNEAWFGDHHEFDVFCLDENGKVIRPWVSIWFDAATGAIVGWCISTNPNSETILISFTHGVAIKPNNEIHGLPRAVYMDNGKDYRGHRFEGGQALDYDIGRLNDEMFANAGALQMLHVQAYHAKPYHGWVKPVERWFRTLEEKYCRELPGYCGGKPEDRTENLDRQIARQIEKGELLTVDELADVFVNQILPAYHNRPHEGYGGQTPMERYRTLPRARNDQPGWATLAILKNERATRTANTQGIRFANMLYWHEELRHVAGQEVTILYHRNDRQSITVLGRDGRYICEAEPKELMKIVGETEEKVANHVAMQKRQEKEVRRMIAARGVKLPGKRASGNMWYEAVDTTAKGNLTSLEAEKAAKGRQATREARRRREEGVDEAANATREMLRAIGDQVLAR